MSNVLGLRIALARKNRGWSQSRLAQAVNQAQTTISSWERGRTEPSRHDVQRIAQVLNVSIVHLEVGTDAPVRSATAPVGQIVFGDRVVKDGAQKLEPDLGTGPEASSPVGLRIGNGAIGRKFSGWLVYHDPARYLPDARYLGSLCVVGLENGTVLVKWVEKSATIGLFHLTSEIDSPLLDQKVLWLSPVLQLIPPFA